MPGLEINELVAANHVTIRPFIEAAQDSCTVTFRTEGWNWKIESSLREIDKWPATGFRDFILDRVISWDLTYHGEPIPVTAEGLLKVDVEAVQIPICESIIAEMRAGKASRTAMSTPSSTAKARSRRSRARGVSPAVP